MSCHHTLAGDWSELVARLDTAGALARWAATEPALAGLAGVEELAELTRHGGDRQRAEEVLGALVCNAAADGGDDQDAVLVVLHLLAPGVYAMADLDGDGDLLAVITGQRAIEIRRFPWRRRRRACAANLLLDTRRAVLGELGVVHGGRARQVSLDGDLDLLVQAAPPADAPTAWAERVDLLAWAVRAQVADATDVQLLWQVQQLHGYGAAAAGRVAAAWGVTKRTVRRRHARALTALQQAASGYLAA